MRNALPKGYSIRSNPTTSMYLDLYNATCNSKYAKFEYDISDPGLTNLCLLDPNKNVCGYISYSQYGSDPTYVVDGIFVDRKHRRKGLAKALLSKAESKGHVFLYVSTRNYSAIKLYESLGYIYVNTVQRFYSHDEDGYKYVKPNDKHGFIDLDSLEISPLKKDMK